MAGIVRQTIHVCYHDGTVLQNELKRRFPGESRTVEIVDGEYVVYGPRLLTQDEIAQLERVVKEHYNRRSKGRSR